MNTDSNFATLHLHRLFWVLKHKRKSQYKMFGIENIYLFIVTGLLLNLMPGPDSMYIIARSVSQGRLAGTCAVFGISSGAIFHTILGSIGLSALIFASAKAFTVVKYLGAMYLFYQAVLMLLDSFKHGGKFRPKATKSSLLKIYKQGAITNILNPKVALFFMALIPQFISPTAPNKSISFLILGLIFITTGTIWCLLLAWFAAFFSNKLRSNSIASKWMLRINAGVFTYLGYQLATGQVESLSD